MRLFIAVNFSAATRAALVSLQETLQNAAVRGRFTAPENLHLTLAFLGECDPAQVAAARAAVDTVSFRPFPIEVTHLGRFRRAGGDICWAGLRESKPLFTLQRDVTARLRLAGFDLEARAYTPHITLAREVQAPENEQTVPPFGETVTQIDLMRSEHIRGKLTYTAIHSAHA